MQTECLIHIRELDLHSRAAIIHVLTVRHMSIKSIEVIRDQGFDLHIKFNPDAIATDKHYNAIFMHEFRLECNAMVRALLERQKF